MDKELTPKQQTSEALRQAETVLILTGQHPSVDQVASATALGSILRKFGKKATTVISDEIPATARFLPLTGVSSQLEGLRDFIVSLDMRQSQVDQVKYSISNQKLNIQVTPYTGGFTQKDVSYSHGDYHFDLVVVLGVASYSRIDRVYAHNAELLRTIPLINIDYHRSNEQFGAINLIEPTAASLGEILIALSESLQSGMIDADIATTMLAGIMSATDRFTASHTTAKALTVAAQMIAMGADQPAVVRGLYRNPKPASNQAQPAREKPPVATQPAPQPKVDIKPEVTVTPEAQVTSAPLTEDGPSFEEVEPFGPEVDFGDSQANLPLADEAPSHSLLEPLVNHEPIEKITATETLSAVKAPNPTNNPVLIDRSN